MDYQHARRIDSRDVSRPRIDPWRLVTAVSIAVATLVFWALAIVGALHVAGVA